MAPINLTTVVHSKQKAIFNLVWNKYFSGPRATTDKKCRTLENIAAFLSRVKIHFAKICAPTKVMFSIIAKTFDMQIMFQLLNAGDN